MTRRITMSEARETALQTLAESDQRREQAALAEAAGSELSPRAKHALELCAIVVCGNSDLNGKNLREIIVKIYGAEVDKELEAYLAPNDKAQPRGGNET